ncbi:unnamed protein product [Penicillium olsonii]|nr:unnamed protein product [Penicillium olsonii]CAG7934240.1 unnamed protein product [Penicillium olsonii]
MSCGSRVPPRTDDDDGSLHRVVIHVPTLHTSNTFSLLPIPRAWCRFYVREMISCNSSTPPLGATPRSWKAFTPFDQSRGLVSPNTHRPREYSPFWEPKWPSGATG